MSIKNSITTLAVALLGMIMFAAACSDEGEDVAGPPIPTLDAGDIGPGIQTVAEGPLNAGCANCVEWSCAIGTCGYDTAYPPGACCTECDFGQPAVPKPNCDPGSGGGGGTCSGQPGAGEFGSDYCRPNIEQDTASAFFDNRCISPAQYYQYYGSYGPADTGDYYFCSSCPISFSCCYGDPWCGDPEVS